MGLRVEVQACIANADEVDVVMHDAVIADCSLIHQVLLDGLVDGDAYSLLELDLFDRFAVLLGDFVGLVLGRVHVQVHFADSDDEDSVVVLLHCEYTLKSLLCLGRGIETDAVTVGLILVVFALSKVLDNHDWQD